MKTKHSIINEVVITMLILTGCITLSIVMSKFMKFMTSFIFVVILFVFISTFYIYNFFKDNKYDDEIDKGEYIELDLENMKNTNKIEKKLNSEIEANVNKNTNSILPSMVNFNDSLNVKVLNLA
ncbi:hypothetical protein HERIO_267 [Hepatospora eriocheir]|uniref:Uncharacterized protein n=1 Tax=Hepatospora eriocheir TaxID=1081669 RepID=A0A1X0QDL7_9MICR|nr:hypothetical protein HERIO_267 [Hepatospora eriocheir]